MKENNTPKKKSAGKIVAVSGVAAAAALLLFMGPGMGLGFGTGTGSGQGNAGQTPTSTTSQNVTDPTLTAPDSTVTTDPVKVIVAVSVVESEYFYQNQKYTLDELVGVLSGMEEGYIVQITDSNASLNAYNNLTAKLTQLSIPYTEG